jgi:hypothetical protein
MQHRRIFQISFTTGDTIVTLQIHTLASLHHSLLGDSILMQIVMEQLKLLLTGSSGTSVEVFEGQQLSKMVA